MALQNPHEVIYLTEEEYLKSELTSDFKREYLDGQAYAMAGAGYNHNCIAGNVFRKFGNHLERKPCTPFMADMKVRLGKDYVYPDVVVDCSKMSGSDMFSENPVLIVEVLSKSTRKTDTAVKLLRYINLPSLQEYVLIEPDFVSVQVLRRNRHWLPEYYFLDDSVPFESIGLKLTVEEIYDRVDNADMNEFRQEKQQNA
ncbi:Uma2 family endonuclease [Methylomicrobium sp. RS1]|uniref:Uma2 family endonuclease n=1 Tax=Candidatus Methylomicrobium oryzae TaxID=2802053 RepID=UPI0019214229|nr:Uma2 family endonuclease [Methylomicrobium sp. RS1]MBL1263201.1 Uma2 family endonuclease [Methylomicrobium sp. RS1]